MLKTAFQGLRDIMWNHVHEFGEQPAHRQILPVVTLNVKYWNNNPLVDYSALELRRSYVLLCPSHKSSSVLHCKFWTQNMLEKGDFGGMERSALFRCSIHSKYFHHSKYCWKGLCLDNEVIWGLKKGESKVSWGDQIQKGEGAVKQSCQKAASDV